MISAGEEVTSSLLSPGGGAISPALELSLTTAYTVLYSLLFGFIYLQLWLVLHYGYKRFSYQSAFLFLCLLWAALRTTLFSFYFENGTQAKQLQPLAYWLLYCCPVCLQFFTLCLLNLYFWQVVFKAKAKYSPELTKYRVALSLLFLSVCIFFLVVNLTCGLLVQGALERSELPSDRSVRHAVLARVLINDGLFVLCAVSLAVCIFRIAKMSSANVFLQSKGTSVCQAAAMGAMVIVLYTSRACYNLVVSLSPLGEPDLCNYSWYTVSDQTDVLKLSGEAYMVFGIILFFWELLPTSLMVLFFRVQKPNQNMVPAGILNSHTFGSRDSFFDNPRRYDSDDDLPRNNRSDRASLPSSTMQPSCVSSWYGSIQCNGTLVSTQPPPSSATAPLLFAYRNVQSTQHHHHNYYSTPQSNQHHHGYNYSTPQS
ncbi:integral membrane protein GPR137C isoform X1 [Corythoichthys intestinalis]|uniref:integral membrane protein GPR137C isoform X1 n=1 Tax=Corythoichthys intestinalis TaxID=161448 RepID=UPI0025A61737|nr:integral membrane protein GPR137C isoform X1 [Corythoichthys intestinalis]